MRHKILLIEDDDASRLAVVRSLSEKGYAVSVAHNLSHSEEDVLARRFDAVIMGINRPDGKGTGFIRGIRVYDPYLPIIVITGCDQIEIAVDAVRCGADNVLAKPIDFAGLHASLRFLLEEGSLKPAREEEEQRRPGQAPQDSIFGAGPASARFLQSAAAAACLETPVLINGETGTGKGILARWIHQHSSRSELPFVGLNCSGLRGELQEIELFGTPAGEGRPARGGLVQEADGGTLFIDEIGDLDLRTQARLLALLRSRSSGSLAGGTGVGGGFRLICCTNQQLDTLVRAGSFHPELFACLSSSVLRIPPLRERLAELPGIVRHLLDALRGPEAQISPEALRALKSYRWPGNLRELKNALELALILSHGARLRPEHFNWLRSTRGLEPRPFLTMSEVKEQHIEAVLQRANGDVNRVASSLGLSRATVYRRLKVLRGKTL